MKIVAILLVGCLLAATAAIAWQQLRYLRARRDVVQDRQSLFYASSTFHVVTFLQVAPGRDPIEAVRELRGRLESSDGAKLVYAGKVAMNGLASEQFDEADWSAMLLVQYPSRAAYDAAARSEAYREALAGFERTYSQGMRRGALINLGLPVLLLARRVMQVVRREPSHFPLVPADELPLEVEGRVKDLLSEPELGRDAILIVNFIRGGTPEQQQANSAYGWKMMGAMAEAGHGPMHVGRAVTVEGDARFDQVVMVYYPGVQYFASLLKSRFFQGIIGGKQLADTQSTVTVPILSLL